MRRLQELKNSKRLLAGPYLFWAVSFIIIPLIMIFYYGLTDNDEIHLDEPCQNHNT